MKPNIDWFKDARYGLFIHYGLYSLLGRGEWVMNRERIPRDEYMKLADRFNAEKFNADELIRRAKNDWGMSYANLTCKHHEGFCLYDSQLTDFTSVKTAAKRDLVAEFVDACNKHGMRISLYHSLNDWTCVPNSVDALENPAEHYQRFIDYVHGQIREIMTNYGKIDVMWYDGWWPYNAEGWQAEKLNEMVRSLQPGILVNGRCGLPGDFTTPEQHVATSREPWESCVTLNNNWGYHKGDHDWKTPKQVAEMLRTAAAGCGNILLNIGPRGDGSVPEESVRILDQVGEWLKTNREAIYETDRFEFYMMERGDARSDFSHSGYMTASGNAFYWHIRNWPGSTLYLGGVQSKVVGVCELATGVSHAFKQEGDRLIIEGFAENLDTTLPLVVKVETEGEPMLYNCGGSRIPNVDHCRYDPLPSEIQWS